MRLSSPHGTVEPATLSLGPDGVGNATLVVALPADAVAGSTLDVLLAVRGEPAHPSVGHVAAAQVRVRESVPPAVVNVTTTPGSTHDGLRYVGAGTVVVEATFDEPLDATVVPEATLCCGEGATLLGVAFAGEALDRVVATFALDANATNGNWTFTLRGARDVSGNAQAVDATLAVVVDTLPPVSALVDAAGQPFDVDAWHALPEVAVHVVATDAGAPVPPRAYYRLDGAAEQEVPAGGIVVRGDGNHSLVVRAVDAGGNAEAPRAHRVRLDATPPLALVTAPANGTLHRGNVTVSGTTGADLSGVRVVEVLLRGADGHLLANVTAQGTLGWTATLPTLGLPDGNATLTARATDAAGNVGPESAPRALRLDNTAPVLQVVAEPDPSNGATRIHVASDEPLAGAPVVRVRADGASWTVPLARVGPLDWAGIFGVTRTAIHNVTATATDLAGNEGAGTRSFIGDVRAPNGPYVLPVPGDALNATAVHLAWDYDEPVEVSFQVDGQNATFAPLGDDNWTLDVAWAEGFHRVAATSRDRAGNARIDTAFYVVDLRAPAITGASDFASVPGGRRATVLANVHDDFGLLSAHVEVELENGTTLRYPMGRTTGSLFRADVGPFAPGQTIRYGVVAEDLAHNVNRTAPATAAVVDVRAPSVAITYPLLWDVDGVTVVNATVADDGALAWVAFLVDGVEMANLTGVSNGPQQWAMDTTALDAGFHFLSVRAGDAAGNVAGAGRAIRVVNPPVVTAALTQLGEPTSAPLALVPVNLTVDVAGGRRPLEHANLTYWIGNESARETRPLSGSEADGYWHEFSGLLPGQSVHWAVEVTDRYGLRGRVPAAGHHVFHAVPDVTDADLGGWRAFADSAFGENDSAPLPENQSYADIREAQVLVAGPFTYFGLNLTGPFRDDRPALYIVDFDLDADGDADANLTAAFTPDGDGGRNWTLTLWDNATGAGEPAAFAHGEFSADGLVLRVAAAHRAEGDAEVLRVAQAREEDGGGDATGYNGVDLSGPVVSFSPPADHPQGVDLALAATATDPSGVASLALTWRLDGGPAATVPIPATLPGAALAPGRLDLQVLATDALGRTTLTPVQSVVVRDTSAPALAIAQAPETLAEDAGAGLVRVTATDPQGVASVTLDAGAGPVVLTPESPTSYVGTVGPFASPGARTLLVTARDVNGNAATATRVVQVTDAAAPSIASVTTVRSLAVGERLAIAATVLEDGAFTATLHLVRDGQATSLPMTGTGAARAATTAPQAAGTLSYFVRATDAAGNVAESPRVDVTVTDGDYPVLTAPSLPAAATEGVAFEVAVDATDGSGIAAVEVRATQGATALVVPLAPAGGSRYAAALALPVAGAWSVSFAARD
ncbi:MAG TPA: Ig-like domain-containing protein, partial [Candidatus Thermoplasmatota archaeon]|nr:Ig-like domain-containing protein [Candidatus Thermoplasmatota archaeon]